MAFVTMTWQEFLKEATDFVEISRSLDDNWELCKKNELEGNAFLKYATKLQMSLPNVQTLNMETTVEPEMSLVDESAVSNNTSQAVFSLEYHILYSISYQVPMLYIKIHKSDGSAVALEDAWHILGTADELIKTKTRSELLEILTQMEHPVLFTPFYAIHPCKTAELLAQMPQSENRVLTFISVMGPFVRLHLDNRYGVSKSNLLSAK